MGLKIESSAFGQGQRIPDKHTGEGEDVSPALQWSGIPEGTRQLALVCHDPDAPMLHGFTHWVVYGIPADASGISEGEGAKHPEGPNDFGSTGYKGPLPPPGHGDHHYYFWLYALDTELGDGPGLTRAELLAKIEDHVIEQNRLVGIYSR